jgi:hypothetical protein
MINNLDGIKRLRLRGKVQQLNQTSAYKYKGKLARAAKYRQNNKAIYCWRGNLLV